jgi:transposase InsO family protein
VTRQLRREGHRVNAKRVERLMRIEAIVGAYVPARRRRDADGLLGVAGVRAWPDLVARDFSPAAPNQAWCADMKQIQTAEGVLHLASVLDLYSRAIVGWAMAAVADTELVATALEMGVARRRPGDGLIHHSDRGTQYTALAFTQRCADAAVIQSNSRPGTPHDNAVKESFFATLQKEHLRGRRFATHEQARSSIFTYIECFYNRSRIHSTLGYRTPAEAEDAHYQQAACA